MRKKDYILPPCCRMERPITISATGGTFEPSAPLDGDGKQSALSLGVSMFCFYKIIMK